VTGVAVSIARDYARWLSERSGFDYRLPGYWEWIVAARGTDDPNRNCRVQLGGVLRGLTPVASSTGTANAFGLVNMLGNVQEWVIDSGTLKVAGGAYRDPIGECAVTTVKPHDGSADAVTGFRLVRDVVARSAL
jgi:formylglycine-generating enzyme required for sulfatase activity